MRLEQKAFVKWTEVMFYKEDNVAYSYFEGNFYKRVEKDMALADLIPGAIEIFRDEGKTIGRRDLIIKILKKKLNSEPSKEILNIIENVSSDIL